MPERLPDGWGEGSPPDDTMLRAYTESYGDLIEDLGRAGGHRVTRTPEWVGMDSHGNFPFLNVAVLLRPVVAADDPVIDEIQEFFEPDDQHTPFLVQSATPTPSFASRGWSVMGHPPFMLRPASAAEPPRPDGLEIVEVLDHDDLTAFETTMVEAYPAPAMAGSRFFTDGLLDAPGWRMWLGRVDGNTVGTAAAHVTDTLVDVEWISARAEYRGRHIGEALTWVATLAEPDLPAVLIASDLGQPLYERMGYLRLARVTLWIGARNV